MKIGEYYQQGDVILKRVAEIPQGKEIKPDERGIILAEGEVTGHCHKITEVSVAMMVKTDDGHVYLHVKTAVPLKHDEHHFIIIEPGEYEVKRVQEFDHFENAAREVAD